MSNFAIILLQITKIKQWISLVDQTTPSAALDVLHHQHCGESGLVNETNNGSQHINHA